MAEELTYWKLNVRYPVCVRRNIMDKIGTLLTGENQYYGVMSDTFRDFKVANKQAILEGLIVQSPPPDLDWETPNALTDEEIDDLLKYWLKLKATLPTLDSIVTVERVLERAREGEKSAKIIKLIKSRLEELTGETDEITSPAEMQGVS